MKTINFELLSQSLVLCLSLCLVGCQADEFYEKEFLENPFTPDSPLGPNVVMDPTGDPPDENLVCDPFQDGGYTVSDQHGIYANLFDAKLNEANIDYLADVIQDAYKVNSDLYFTQLNVTPRSFTEGFSGPDGTPLTNSSGDMLYEWFGLRFSGRFTLTDNDEAGYYELITHSDDGVIVRVTENGETREVLNDDGWHAPRIGCANEYIYLDHTKTIDFEIDYFQGPRTQIAMVLYWRKVASTPEGLGLVTPSSLCGQGTTAPTVNGLLADGFNKLTPENYLLPRQISSNPCAD